MVSTGTTAPHQFTRAAGREFAVRLFMKGQANTHLSADGQPDCSLICEHDGRHPLSKADEESLSVVAVVSPQRNNALSRVPSRCTKHCGR